MRPEGRGSKSPASRGGLSPTGAAGLASLAMTPLGLTDQQLKTVLDVAGFLPRRLRRKFLKDIAAQLPVVPGTKKSLSTLRDSDVERAIGDVLVNLDATERSKEEV